MAKADVAGVAAAAPFAALLGRLDPRRPVLVQTHDYPDIDAVASAWALSGLLARRGYSASAAYRGEIRSRSLARLVEVLGIEIAGSSPAGDRAQLLVVDGAPANGNVSLFAGELVGIVDHHRIFGEARAPFADLRPELASCSSMIYGYWKEAGAEPPRELATALIAGIQSDTDFLSRRSSPEDFRAYTELFRLGDWELASRIVRTVFDLRELGLIARALSGAVAEEGLLYAEVEGPCGQEALAVLADFALRAEELRATVVAERDEA
ncbi:MAG TPA: DHH family phosphoesterase, partial [Spirochaetia bacterium]|nr:DHH family phosphoesterase [Spirochaetia bacterium]